MKQSEYQYESFKETKSNMMPLKSVDTSDMIANGLKSIKYGNTGMYYLI